MDKFHVSSSYNRYSTKKLTNIRNCGKQNSDQGLHVTGPGMSLSNAKISAKAYPDSSQSIHIAVSNTQGANMLRNVYIRAHFTATKATNLLKPFIKGDVF